jgi:hypothetical protein
MSGSLAMSSISAVNSAIAAEQARQAKEAACTITIQQFNAKGATVEEMKSYAECVQTLYPDATYINSPGMKVSLGFVIGCVLVGIMLGLHERDNIEGVLLRAFFSMVGGLVFVLFAWLFYSVYF